MSFKPMLAPHESPQTYPDFFKKMQYPLLASPKLDGIRCIIKEDVKLNMHSLDDYDEVPTGVYKAKSRTFLDIPSTQVQEIFSNFPELDGELIEGDETDHDVYNRTQSHVMSVNNPSSLMQFRVFDCADVNIKDEPFILRLEHAGKLIKEYKEHFFGHVSLVEHTLIEDYDELVAYEDIQLALGYEGIMMRDPSGPYKHGRGTYKQGYIYKLKRFTDTEGVIVGFVEQNTNTNEDTKSELGYAKRSSSKEGMALAGTLGKFLVDYNGITIPVGPGHFDHKQRKLIWENPCLYINKILKYRYFAHGMKDLPRHPRALGWRDKMDM